MDDSVTKRYRAGRGVLEAFTAFEMTLYALYKKGNIRVLLFLTNQTNSSNSAYR